MAKGSGLGARFYVGGYDISGDVQALDTIGGGLALIDSTDITQSAHSRLPGLRDGTMDVTTFFDKLGEHVPLSALPTADEIMSFFAPPMGIGSPVASLNAKQINYDPTRGTDGSLTQKTQGQGSGFGLEWGLALTSGTRTDTSATNGTSLNTTAALAFGGQMYVHLTGFTGTSVTIALQDSADNSTFAGVSGMTTSALTAIGAVRLAITNTSTIRQYVRIATTGTFSSAAFAVMLNKNPIAGVTF